MPITTSQVNACDVVVQLDNGAGVLADISGSSNEVSMDFTNQLGQLSVFGADFYVRQECKRDASISLSLVYTQDDAEAMNILLDWYFATRGQKSLRVEIPNGDPGGDRFDFEVFLESFPVPVQSDDANPILVAAVLKPTGTFSRSVIGS